MSTLKEVLLTFLLLLLLLTLSRGNVLTLKYSQVTLPSAAWTPSETLPDTKSALVCESMARRRQKYMFSYSKEQQGGTILSLNKFRFKFFILVKFA